MLGLMGSIFYATMAFGTLVVLCATAPDPFRWFYYPEDIALELGILLLNIFVVGFFSLNSWVSFKTRNW